MSCIFFNPFTFKRTSVLILLSFFVFIFNNVKSYAAEEPSYTVDTKVIGQSLINFDDMKIIGHYYVANDATSEKYTDKIQWQVANTTEWRKFLTHLKTLPEDEIKDNPAKLKQHDFIHFNVVDDVNIKEERFKSGHDVFLSSTGIQQFSKIPLVHYYDNDSEFKEFLDTELKLNLDPNKNEEKPDINQPGIVVVFRGSASIKNPYWVIPPSRVDIFNTYKHFVEGLKDYTLTSGRFIGVRDSFIDTEDTYILYLNYKDAPFDFVIMGTDGTLRSTKIISKNYFFKDPMNYYSLFKKQSEDSIKEALKEAAEAPKEEKKPPVKLDTLF